MAASKERKCSATPGIAATPSTKDGGAQQQQEQRHRRVSLAYVNLVEPPANVLDAYGAVIQELDISHNKVRELRWLQALPNLHTLIADDNHIPSDVELPPCGAVTRLRTLWLNRNRISNLTTFMLTLSRHCPRLRYLSMMQNPAAPSYFNGGSYKQYTDYRQYVVSQLSELQWLDDTAVTAEERREAERVYRKMVLPR